MATQAQITANRLNAKKSTGPRTPEGKAISSQNALKHGLTAKRDIIKSESQTEFNHHRRRFFAELGPSSAIEYLLAERIISLSWRLKRACSIHNLTIDALSENPLAQRSKPVFSSSDEMEPEVPDLNLGRMAIYDFANLSVLDGLIMYERRIEHSLYRTLFEFERLQAIRKKENPNEVDEETEQRLMCDRTLSASGCEK
jgi:hypothetical protein